MSPHAGPSPSSNGDHNTAPMDPLVKPVLLPPLLSASEGPPTMTIEFLRARLLSERSASKEARQQALLHEKRISELRQQIEAEVCLRQKAEADVDRIFKALKHQGLHTPISSAINATSPTTSANERWKHSSVTEEIGAATELQQMQEQVQVETVPDSPAPPIAIVIAKDMQQKEDIESPSNVDEGSTSAAAIAEEKQQSLGVQEEEEEKVTLTDATQESGHNNISERQKQNQDEVKRAPEETPSLNRRHEEEEDMAIDEPSFVSNPSSSTGSSTSVGKSPSNTREEGRRRVVVRDHHRRSFKSPSSISESSGNHSNEDEDFNQASSPFQAKLYNPYLPDMAAAYGRVRSSHLKPQLQRSSTVSADRNGSYGRRTSLPSLADEGSGRLGDILTALRLAKKQITSFHHVHGLEEQQQYSDGNSYYHVSSSPSGSRDSSSFSPSPSPSQSPLYGYPVDGEAFPWNPYAAHAPSTSPYYCNGSEAMLRLQRSASTIHHYYNMPPPQAYYRSPKKEVQLGNGIVLFTD